MSKKQTPAGVAGNAKSYTGIPLRQWNTASYGANDGRSVSSLATDQDGRGSPSTTHVEGASRQMTDAFFARDARCTQNSTPVRKRPFTQENQ